MIEYCRNVSPNGQRIIDDSYRRDLLCQAFIRHEILRLWGLRNFWLSRSEETQTYEGAQTYYFQKVTGMWFDHVIAEIVGPSGLVWSTEHGAAEGSLGRAQASSIGGSHGGGTIDIQRVVMARRMGIGRAEAEAGATLA
jgi:hypothetical protein